MSQDQLGRERFRAREARAEDLEVVQSILEVAGLPRDRGWDAWFAIPPAG